MPSPTGTDPYEYGKHPVTGLVFQAETEPTSPVEGQVYRSSTDSLLRQYLNGAWSLLSAGSALRTGLITHTYGVQPSGPIVGDLWTDPALNRVRWWDGTIWRKVNAEPVGTLRQSFGPADDDELPLGGGTYPSASYPLLASYLGVSSGNFTLPNMARRFPVGVDSSDSAMAVAKVGGIENKTLSMAEMPTHQHGGATDAQGYHNHAVYSSSNSGSGVQQAAGANLSGRTGAAFIDAAGNHAHNIVTDFRGSSSPFSIQPMFLTFNCYIKAR